MDSGDASCSFLMNPRTRAWSDRMIGLLGLDADKLPPIREPSDILGAVTSAAASETGLQEGTPVLVGGADYPMALIGSGACRPGLASDVTGTSCILTLIADAPLLDPEICNVATIEGHWGPFVLLETGGDAMRWARRAFHEKALSYDDMTARAASAPAGSDGLIFMPYLTGERLGAHRNARAQFFGLGAGHGLAHLHRAILEGVAFAAARHLRIMEKAAGRRIERVIASGGGARSAALAQDQGECLRGADRRSAGTGMRGHRLRRDGGHGGRPFRPDRRRRPGLCAPCRRGEARPGMGQGLRADAAGVRQALRAFAGALRRPRRARRRTLT